MLLARLLEPKDFGLVGMVTAFTGILSLFRDFGLSSATVQRETVTDDQLSTLFWINVLLGAILCLLTVAGAPAIAGFYHEPRLLGVTTVLGIGFLLNGAGTQHSAILQRQMRFTALAVVSTIGLIVGTAVAVAGAMAGYGYWALVAMTVTMPLTTTIGFWFAAGWNPGVPRRSSGIRSMMRFGGTLTLNSLVAYLAYNFEKVLLGRFWGVDAIGIYGRAYQLINIPTDNLNVAVGEVAFSALSRIQNDRRRLKNYFLKGYSLVLSLTVPITIICACFADDVIAVGLGPKWKAAAIIFRLLAPTILIFAIINPIGWWISALGLVDRGLKIALVFAPLIIMGYFIGLPYGPKGVAVAYSSVMLLWVLPHIAWCVHGTDLSFRDVTGVAMPLLTIGLIAGGISVALRSFCCTMMSPLLRLIIECAVVLVTFVGLLSLNKGQRSLYFDFVRGLKKSSAQEMPVDPVLETSWWRIFNVTSLTHFGEAAGEAIPELQRVSVRSNEAQTGRSRTALVTGASSGIGRAIALALARLNFRLVIVGRDPSTLAETVSEISQFSEAEAFRLDLAHDRDLEPFFMHMEKGVGKLDVLIHSAGTAHLDFMRDAHIEDFDLQYTINVRAPYLLTQRLLPLLEVAKGQVVFINSTVGIAAKRPEIGQYAATKHALKAIADSLREEANPKGVRVLSLYLGRTATRMQETLHRREGRVYHPEVLLQPEDIASLLVQTLLLPPTAEVTEISIRPMQKSY
jgi:O-antigen/teichoic acid export membrane protein/NADP-dependent 3-hydroxy acid dehydrogenase YdfG